MDEIDKLKKLLKLDQIKDISDLEEKLSKEIFESCMKVLKENAVNDLVVLNLTQMVNGMAIGIGMMMKEILPQLTTSERMSLSLMLMQRMHAILQAISE